MAELVRFAPRSAGEPSTFQSLMDLYTLAVQEKFGHEIRIIVTPETTKELNKLDFELFVLSGEKKAREDRRTVVDVVQKEYINRSKTKEDETYLIGNKEDPRPEDTRYEFSAKFLNNFEDIRDYLGGLVIELARKGERLSIKHHQDRIEKLAATKRDITNSYEQKEKIPIPPRSRVKAVSTTYEVKYKQDYELEVSTDADAKIPVKYFTRCVLCLCCCMPCTCPKSTGYITAAELLQSLPDFQNRNGRASFVEKGTLSYMGALTKLDKEPYPIEEEE